MATRRVFRRRAPLIASVLGLFLLYHFFSTLEPRQRQSQPIDERSGSPCPPLPGMEDVLVVLKTGVTEARDKVPVHFDTTLRCVPNFVIFSDFAEEIQGVQIHDALANMDDEVKRSVPDFDIYNRIQELGRAGLERDDFADEANSAIGKPNNPGWKLDKWKFLPMVQETLKYKGDAKWYVFMEADTYFSWPTLLEWLAHFDQTKPWYIGTETQIADVIFAHGGSGFAVSKPAMQLVSDAYTTRNVELNEYTDIHWAGDCVLGKVLSDVGVPLHYSWPILQNSNVGELDQFTQGFYRRPWCFPAVAFHHLQAKDIQDLWAFETQRWRAAEQAAQTRSIFRPQLTRKRILLHSDIFKELIFPALSGSREKWDNLSDEEHSEISSFRECQRLCEKNDECTQFAIRERKCYTGKHPRLGVAHGDTRSGWLVPRVEKMMNSAPSCSTIEWGA
ncbi:glycosyltransferase family 31 protein [Aspergillus candidus]|uniref:N-acetylgalactosaminide beta-1,3-galactosyltransferase n=1 Tax=Aspergillus candidus TaxID=41067 RepID=A0A2I2F2I8_ASPCN|nr:hypothetical protein BDW47DRAFT_70697 [Aspergillus candidus]PLB34843.1 hypothetical protein BDW47DRAFT_70697 [Aspergillus candidus]